MRVLVVGNRKSIEEFNNKFGEQNLAHEYTCVEDHSLMHEVVAEHDIVFDFLIDESPENIEIYEDIEDLVVFANVVKSSLAEIAYFNDALKCRLIGFNGMPTFFDRDILELSLSDGLDKKEVESICAELGTAYEIVEDRVGMVTPRVICMIINEAYYTVQEGTANKEDIDQGMKLGTNYPYGPFEWCEKIGLAHVYELLEALYEDTKDQRYKICPMLKRDYLLKK